MSNPNSESSTQKQHLFAAAVGVTAVCGGLFLLYRSRQRRLTTQECLEYFQDQIAVSITEERIQKVQKEYHLAELTSDADARRLQGLVVHDCLNEFRSSPKYFRLSDESQKQILQQVKLEMRSYVKKKPLYEPRVEFFKSLYYVCNEAEYKEALISGIKAKGKRRTISLQPDRDFAIDRYKEKCAKKYIDAEPFNVIEVTSLPEGTDCVKWRKTGKHKLGRGHFVDTNFISVEHFDGSLPPQPIEEHRQIPGFCKMHRRGWCRSADCKQERMRNYRQELDHAGDKQQEENYEENGQESKEDSDG